MSEHYHRAIKAHRLAEAFEAFAVRWAADPEDRLEAARIAPPEFWGRLAKWWNADHGGGHGRRINPPSAETIQTTLGILRSRMEERDS